MLFVVSTPIGNLQDITLRALETLKEVDFIAAEDTRHTRVLLRHYAIQKPLVSYHDYNKARRAPEIVRRLLAGEKAAVVSDAGTPGISDPAYHLVRQCIEAGVPVQPIPGPTAFVAALIVSGLPTDRFVFEGFLPAKKGRQKRLGLLREETRTIVLYEAPHRLLRTLEDLLSNLGDRQAAIVRELTKIHEEVQRGPLSELIEWVRKQPPRGEIVLVVEGRTRRLRKAEQARKPSSLDET